MKKFTLLLLSTLVCAFSYAKPASEITVEKSESAPIFITQNNTALTQLLDNAPFKSIPLNESGTLNTQSSVIEIWETQKYAVAYKITLTKGTTVQIDNIADFDAYLYLYAKQSNNTYFLEKEDNDGGGDANARILYTPLTSGDYYIIATHPGEFQTGGFTVKVQEKSVMPVFNFLNTVTNTIDLASTPVFTELIRFNDQTDFIDLGAGDLAYAVAYKINMQKDEEILLNYRGDFLIYKETNGNYLPQRGDRESFTADETAAYYLTLLSDRIEDYNLLVTKKRDINFTEVSLGYNDSNLQFNNVTYLNGPYGIMPFVGYKFTLTEEKGISLSTNQDVVYFLVNDEELDPYSIIAAGDLNQNPTVQLSAGTFYLFISMVEGETYDLSISAAGTFYNELTLPGQLTNVNFNESAWTEIATSYGAGIPAMGYKFTINEDSEITIETNMIFTLLNAPEITGSNSIAEMMSGKHTSKPLPAGTYYLFVTNSQETTFNLSVTAAPKAFFTPVSLPYIQQNISYTDNPLVIDNQLGFKFTLPRDTSIWIEVNSNTYDVESVILTTPFYNQENIVFRTSYYPEITPVKLKAGTYYLILQTFNNNTTLDLTLKESGPKAGNVLYTEIDYSARLNGTTTQSMDWLTTPNVNTTETSGYAHGYTVAMQAGKYYKLDLTSSSNYESYISLLTGGSLSGNFDSDMLSYRLGGETSTLVFTPQTTGDYRILVQNNFNNENIYTLKIQEIQVSASLTFTNISVPETISEADFTAENTTVYSITTDGETFVLPVIGYRLTLNQASTVSLELMSEFRGALLLATDAGMTDVIAAGASIIEQLSAGTYYVLVASDWYYGKYSLIISSGNASDDTPITIAELLDGAENINSRLPFTYSGTFGLQPTKLVQGDGSFGHENSNYYAVAYKITANANESFYLKNEYYSESMVYIYKKEGGTYTQLDERDYDLFTTIPAAGDYYFIFSTYDEETKGAFQAEISVAPEAITLTELLNSVNTASSLPFERTGNFGSNPSKLVESEGEFESKAYAEAYKFNLQTGNELIISQTSDEVDSYVYLYKKNGPNYDFVSKNDDYDESDSRLDYTVSEAGEYYVIFSTYDYKTGSFTGKVMLTSQQITINSLTANPNSITVSTTASDAEIKLALSQVTITANVSSGSAPAINNTPFIWTISQDGASASATFDAPTGYLFADGVGTVTVTINKTSSLDTNNSIEPVIYAIDKNIYIMNVESNVSLAIYDMMGRLYVNTLFVENGQSFTVPASGMYIVRVGSEVKKIQVK